MAPTSFDRRYGIESIDATRGGDGVVHVFCHGITAFQQPAFLRAMGPAIERWPERALLLARPHDIVCLAAPVEAAYRDWLSRFGLGVAAVGSWCQPERSMSRVTCPS